MPRCCAVTQTRRSTSELFCSSVTTGAILMASGLVPNIAMTFFIKRVVSQQSATNVRMGLGECVSGRRPQPDTSGVYPLGRKYSNGMRQRPPISNPPRAEVPSELLPQNTQATQSVIMIIHRDRRGWKSHACLEVRQQSEQKHLLAIMFRSLFDRAPRVAARLPAYHQPASFDRTPERLLWRLWKAAGVGLGLSASVRLRRQARQGYRGR